jgi:hypothetical protein
MGSGKFRAYQRWDTPEQYRRGHLEEWDWERAAPPPFYVGEDSVMLRTLDALENGLRLLHGPPLKPLRARVLAALGRFVEHASDDDVRILDCLRQRLELGHAEYGGFNVEREQRDWWHEASEEALDCAVYLAARLVRGRE